MPVAVGVPDPMSCATGGAIAAGRFHRNGIVRDLAAPGTQTIGSSPLSIILNGFLYAGWIGSAGIIGVSKLDLATNVATSFTLATGFEQDSHDNATVFALPDGRLLCAWQRHGADSIIRYRISTSPEDISAFGAQQTIAVTGSCTYNQIFRLSANGKVYVMYRAGDYTTKLRASADLSAWDTERTWISNPPQRPYPVFFSNGVDRVDLFFTTGHPNEVATSLYHAYMQLDAGVEKFYKSDGTYIGLAGSVTPATATLVYNGSVNRAWGWGIVRDANGYPRVLFTKFVTVGSDHRCMFARWTGTAWTTPLEITPVGGYLYADQPWSDAQSCFDSEHIDRVYLSRTVSGKKLLQEWITTDDGATWAYLRDLSDGVLDAFTPSSPKGHDSRLTCVFNYGTMTRYLAGDWSVALKGI